MSIEAALQVCAHAHKMTLNESGLRQFLARNPVGPLLDVTSDAANVAGFKVRKVNLDAIALSELQPPFIIEAKRGELLVVMSRSLSGAFRLFDGSESFKVKQRELVELVSGWALEVLENNGGNARQKPVIGIRSLLSLSLSDLKTASTVIWLSIIVQAYTIVSPLFMRVVIDGAIANSDLDLLNVIFVVFLLLTLFNFSVSWLRGIIAQKINSAITWRLSAKTYSHLISLPMRWFNSRRLADVLSRLQGLDQIKTVISTAGTSLLDGLIGLTLGIVLLIYCLPIGIVAWSALFLYILVRSSSIPIMLRWNEKIISANVLEQSKRIETIRAIQSIKAMGFERDRERDWGNKMAQTINVIQKSSNIALAFTMTQSLISSSANFISIFVGARYVLTGDISIGVLVSAIAYQSQFMQRSIAFFEQMSAWRMLDVHRSRVEEILLSDVEDVGVFHEARAQTLSGVEIIDLKFGYDLNRAPIITRASAVFAAGTNTIITGPSGTGKTTLLKLIAGLHMPDEGKVLINGLPLTQFGISRFRKIVGTVLQDDELLSGSIFENVTFFAPEPDIDWFWQCLAVAEMAEDVRKMRDGENTFVGEMGGGISGGQKQRLLIARALYRKPLLLVMDEATSHLDVEKERAIGANLDRIGLTRIAVAHRPGAMNDADRILRLQAGELINATAVSGTPAVGS